MVIFYHVLISIFFRRMSSPPKFFGIRRRPYTAAEAVEARRPMYSMPSHQVSRDDWARAQYRAASRAGRTKKWFQDTFQHGDMRVMDEHVAQMFWQMVREEQRTNPKFDSQMQFIASFYEMPQHEFLERLMARHWAQMQPMTDDRSHRVFLLEVFRAWRAAKDQIEDVDPAHDERRAHAAWLRQEAEEFSRRQWAGRHQTERFDDEEPSVGLEDPY